MDIQKIVTCDEPTWETWLTEFDSAPFPDDGIALALLQENNSCDVWIQFADARMSAREDLFFTVSRPLRHFRSWISNAYLTTVDGPESWAMRLEILQLDIVDDGAFERAVTLNREVEEDVENVDRVFLAEVQTVVMRGALLNDEWSLAIRMGHNASRLFTARNKLDRTNYVMRRLAAAHGHQHNFEKMFEVLDVALETKGPWFGGDARSVSRTFDDPFTNAIEEFATTVTWASLLTPEYVRATGGLAEHAPPDVAPFLWGKFDHHLERMLQLKNNDDVEVVVRHAIERNQSEVASRALELARSSIKQEPWYNRYEELVAQIVAINEVRDALERDTDVGYAKACEHFDRLEADGILTESDFAFTLVEWVLDHLIEQRDHRAVTLQERMIASKKTSWGECPAAWLEEQNLALVYRDLHEPEKAIEVFDSLIPKMIAHYGDEHHAVTRAQSFKASLQP